jgi:hypothetical protein
MVEIRCSGRDLRMALGGCAVLLLAAWAGAWWDQSARAGWSTWVSLCRTGTPDWFTVLQLYAQLMPGSVLGLLGAGLLWLGAAAALGPGLARGSLAGHAACLLAMPASIYACALAAGAAASTRMQLATMAAVDLGLTLVLMGLVLWLLRPVHWPARATA